jgi:hypothetical protein
MVRLVRVVLVVPVHPAVPVADRARHRIARPAGTEFIDVREYKISLGALPLSRIRKRKVKMNDLLILFLIMAGWIFVQVWLLPRMGIST